jgi:hypothetical protein
MVKEMDDDVERCRGCGKLVEKSTAHVVIERVAKKNPHGGARSKSAWGRMHLGCFARMTGKPRDLLEVLGEKETQLLASTG